MIAFFKGIRGHDVALVGVCLLLIGGGIYGCLREDKSGPDGNLIGANDAKRGAPRVERRVGPPQQETRPSDREHAQQVIEKHLKQVEEEPKSEDAPALICAAGNLYRQKLGKYEDAVQCYLRVIDEYPDWEGLNRVYLNLATCYEFLGKTDDEAWVYKRMMEKYGPETQEYQYAQSRLKPK